MNNCIKSISKVYLIILIPLAFLLVISNILIFAEDKPQQQQQKQNITIASDVKDPSFFSFFEKIKNTTETASIKDNVIESSIVIESPTVKDNVKESSIVNVQNHARSQDIQVLMMLDIPELKETLMDVKESLADGDTEEALTDVVDLENQFLLLQNKTKLTEDFQKIKKDISKTDFKKALDDITTIQTAVIKAETAVLKTHLSNPELIATGQEEEENGEAN